MVITNQLVFDANTIKAMVLIDRIKRTFHRLQWKLTLSYTAVTVGALLLAVLIPGLLLFSTILAPQGFLSPELWINMVTEQVPPYCWRWTR